jgi:hypothetical protein
MPVCLSVAFFLGSRQPHDPRLEHVIAISWTEAIIVAHCYNNVNRDRCWNIPGSLCGHCYSLCCSPALESHYCNNDRGLRYCKNELSCLCLSYHCCICYSLGRAADVTARDMAWRTPLEFQFTRKSTSFQSCLNNYLKETSSYICHCFN